MNSDKLFYISVGVVSLLVFGVILFFSQSKNANLQKSLVVDQNVLIGKDANIKGNLENAKVVLVEFSDFQCPACKVYNAEVNKILDENKDTVALVYKHFPLISIHNYSKQAAIASEAAKKQNKFFEYSNILFEKQTTNEFSFKEQDFIEFAKQLSLDIEKFKADLTHPEVLEKVQADMNLADTLGLNSTPTFYINGIKFVGNDLYGEVKKVLETK
ncbi:DsbA family protein [Patescibacteria group bacterium]|nr:DsbA family protein [Patescibacteria group bacterium]